MALKLTVENVEAGYGAVRALHGVSLDIVHGETVVLLGTNGNGKSTLMKCIMGIVRPTSGSVTLEMDGRTHDLTRLSTEEIVNLGVSMVPEGRRLFPKLTVEENLLLGAFRPLARGDIAKNLEYCYATFPALKERAPAPPARCRAVAADAGDCPRADVGAEAALVDEPSVGLAPILVSHTITTIKALKQVYGPTVLMAEQNFNQAAHPTDGYIIVHGEIVFDGRSVAALEQNDLVKSYYLGT